MHYPIAYTYEADHHCEACAFERFGRAPDGYIIGIDGESNAVGAVAPWDEWWEPSERRCQLLACGDCSAALASVHVEGCRTEWGTDELTPDCI